MQYLSMGIVYVFEFLITVSFSNRVMDKKMEYSKILVCTFRCILRRWHYICHLKIF